MLKNKLTIGVVAFILGLGANSAYTKVFENENKLKEKFATEKKPKKVIFTPITKNIKDSKVISQEFNTSNDKLTQAKWKELVSKIEIATLKNIVMNSVSGNNGNKLIHILSSQGSLDHQLIKNLIEKGFDINAKNNQGETPLLLAMKSTNNLEDIRALIAMGADIEVKSNNGQDVLMSAFLNDTAPTRREMIDFLVNEQGFSYTNTPDKYLKSMMGDESNIPYVMDILPSLNKENYKENMQTILFYGMGNDEIVDFFTDNDVVIDQPLFNAMARSKNVSIERIQLAMDNNPLDVNKGSRALEITPLMAAVESGDIQKVEFFLKNGANPYLSTTRGNNAFDLLENNPITKYWVPKQNQIKIKELLNLYGTNKL